MANQGQPLASGGWCTLGEKKEKKAKRLFYQRFLVLSILLSASSCDADRACVELFVRCHTG
jgi:hypothetical protein